MPTRKEQIDRITNDLEQGIRDVFTSGRFASYLKTMSRFHRYSLNNTILIHLQKPDATLLMGYRGWQNQFNRSVRRGEKGIQILAPAPYTKTVLMDALDEDRLPVFDPDGNQIQHEKKITVPAFRPAYVFDISQTEGEPLSTLAKSLDRPVDHFETLFSAMKESAGIPVDYADLPFSLDGLYHLTEQKILLREGMGESQTLCALVHEIAHSMLHSLSEREAGNEKDPRTMEVEAESVAYAVCAFYGIETGENSFGYIASWSENKELPELRKSLSLIRSTASDLIERIDRNLLVLEQEKAQSLEPVSILDRLERNKRLMQQETGTSPKREVSR